MAQFDVHRNPGKTGRDIPFAVVVQSSIYDAYHRRVVVPLVRKSAVGVIANSRLNPTFKIKNITVVLHPLEMVSVSLERLGERVESLAEQGDIIVGALDELLSRAWE
jgi:toxin CcdB